MNEVYRAVIFPPPGRGLDETGVHLVNRVRGSDWICGPLDLDLTLADDHGGFRSPILVKSITKLSPDEAKAIPPKFMP